MAVSSLEHVNSEEVFYYILNEIQKGVCQGELVCLVINSNVIEIDKESNVIMETYKKDTDYSNFASPCNRGKKIFTNC